MKILSDRMLRIKSSAKYSRWTCVDRPSRSADEQLHNNAPHRKRLKKTTTACVSLLVFFRIRRGTFPYSVEDEASTISQTPTTYYTNTCVKLTIVTHLSFSERVAIANLSSTSLGGKTVVSIQVADFQEVDVRTLYTSLFPLPTNKETYQ